MITFLIFENSYYYANIFIIIIATFDTINYFILFKVVKCTKPWKNKNDYFK